MFGLVVAALFILFVLLLVYVCYVSLVLSSYLWVGCCVDFACCVTSFMFVLLSCFEFCPVFGFVVVVLILMSLWIFLYTYTEHIEILFLHHICKTSLTSNCLPRVGCV